MTALCDCNVILNLCVNLEYWAWWFVLTMSSILIKKNVFVTLPFYIYEKRTELLTSKGPHQGLRQFLATETL